MDNATYQETLKSLKTKYKKETLTVQEVAKELSVSPETLRAGIKAGLNVPSYRILGVGEMRKKVIFPVSEVAKFISNLQVVY